MQYRTQDDWMDSTLWVEGNGNMARHAILTLRIKVFMLQMAPTVRRWTSRGRPRSQRTIAWDAPSWQSWRDDVRREVERGWNHRLYLEPHAQWLRRGDRPASEPYAPSVGCRLRIEYVPREQAHVVIRCYRLPDPTPGRTPFLRSNMQAPFNPSARSCSLHGGDVYGNLDSRDVLPRSRGQLPVVHEFGHYIGLSHVNAAASPDNTNADLAYGTGRQRDDMMGAGTRVEPWHAYPWARRLRRHLGGEQPRATDWVSRDPMNWKTGTGDESILWTARRGHARPVWLGRQAELVLDGV